MNPTTKYEIYCKGRYHAIDGLHKCHKSFSHIGNWNDPELIEHQKWEEIQDSKKDWWVGYDINTKFEMLKDKTNEVQEDN